MLYWSVNYLSPFRMKSCAKLSNSLRGKAGKRLVKTLFLVFSLVCLTHLSGGVLLILLAIPSAFSTVGDRGTKTCMILVIFI